MSVDELEKAMKSWPYPWPDYLELLKKVRDEAVTSAATEEAKAKAIAGYSDRLSGILDWLRHNPDGLPSPDTKTQSTDGRKPDSPKSGE